MKHKTPSLNIWTLHGLYIPKMLTVNPGFVSDLRLINPALSPSLLGCVWSDQQAVLGYLLNYVVLIGKFVTLLSDRNNSFGDIRVRK